MNRINISWENKFNSFVSSMLSRLLVGKVRYGEPSHAKYFMTRLYKEFRAYKNTGNKEHLLNIANYACMEFYWPENYLSHFDPTVDSVTRDK